MQAVRVAADDMQREDGHFGYYYEEQPGKTGCGVEEVKVLLISTAQNVIVIIQS